MRATDKERFLIKLLGYKLAKKEGNMYDTLIASGQAMSLIDFYFFFLCSEKFPMEIVSI